MDFLNKVKSTFKQAILPAVLWSIAGVLFEIYSDMDYDSNGRTVVEYTGYALAWAGTLLGIYRFFSIWKAELAFPFRYIGSLYAGREIQRFKKLHDNDLITKEEFDAKVIRLKRLLITP